MSSKPPPVPPENRSPKGTGDATGPSADERDPGGNLAPDTEKQAEPGNTRINTTHQGHQQDR